jgi:8-oxo-dGTP pyrophosphatase MutT (NUDIX family)
MKLGAGVIPLSIETGRVLLGLRSAACNEPHTWAGFGGVMERCDTTLRDTALRELAEETGYIGPVRLVLAVNAARGGTRARVYVGLVPEEFEPVLNWEHDMALWLDPRTLDETKLHWTARAALEEYNRG